MSSAADGSPPGGDTGSGSTRKRLVEIEMEEVAPTKKSKATKTQANVKPSLPNPDQAEVVQILKDHFSVKKDEATGKWLQGEYNIFESLGHLRKHLCKEGVFVTQDWFENNLTLGQEPIFDALKKCRVDFYVAKTGEAEAVKDWVRMAIFPPEFKEWCGITIAGPYDKKGAQQVVLKLGVGKTWGSYEFPEASDSRRTDFVDWPVLERHLATRGLPDRLWQHPGATIEEKLSLVKYLLDFQTL
jgi:hypothetical protein